MIYLYFNGLLYFSQVHCAAFERESSIEGSGIEGSGIYVDFDEGNFQVASEATIGPETFDHTTRQPADYNNSTAGYLFSKSLNVQLCLVEILDTIETKKILSDLMKTVVESVLPGRWINTSINVKINEFNFEQSAMNRNALIEINFSGEYHEPDKTRTSLVEFLDRIIIDAQEAIDFVVQSGSSSSPHVEINPECRPTFSTEILSNSSTLPSDIQTPTTGNMITYPFEDFESSSLTTDNAFVSDTTTTDAITDKTDTLSIISMSTSLEYVLRTEMSTNRDDHHQPTTDLYPLYQDKSTKQTQTTSFLRGTSFITNSPATTSPTTVYPTTDFSTQNYPTTANSPAASSSTSNGQLSWEMTNADENTSVISATTSRDSFVLNGRTTDFYSEITQSTTDHIPFENLSFSSTSMTYETTGSPIQSFKSTDSTVFSTSDDIEYFTEVKDGQSTTGFTLNNASSAMSSFDTDENTVQQTDPMLYPTGFWEATDQVASTTDMPTTTKQMETTNGPIQTTYSPNRVYYLSEPRKFSNFKVFHQKIKPFRLWKLDRPTTKLPMASFVTEFSW